MDAQTLAAALALSKGSGGGGGGGSGGGYLKVGLDGETMALDKTWNEIKTAIENGYYVSVVVYIPFIPEWNQTRIDRCAGGVDYTVYAHWISGSEYGEIRYVTNSSDGYPIMQDDG